MTSLAVQAIKKLAMKSNGEFPVDEYTTGKELKHPNIVATLDCLYSKVTDLTIVDVCVFVCVHVCVCVSQPHAVCACLIC